MPQPSLIVVTGQPGAGKTTLAHALARAVRCPAVCRDEIKEGLVNASGSAGGASDELARRANDAFFQTIALLLHHGATLVAEAAFQHKLWAPQMEPFREVARLRIVVCAVAPALARSRHAQRMLDDPERARFHDDAAFQAASALQGEGQPYDPPRLDVPTLTVDTSDGYQPAFDQIVSFVRG